MAAYYSRAIARDHLGDKQGALTDYNIYLETKPLDKEALFSRAVARFDFGQWAMSKEDPDSYMASHNLAVLSVASQDNELSEKLLIRSH
ncbi:MAG: hypothetical protein IPK96_20630 [Flammeovirgaceae bacterium]|nr:hypothetical protein [Flammeovirgaceae bacterium]